MEREVLVIAAAGDLQDSILSVVAAQELKGRVATDAAQAVPHWQRAETVVIAQDLAEELAAHSLPHRDQVFLVGNNESVLATWSTPLGAKVLVIPEQLAWLGAVLDEGSTKSGAPVYAFLGGSGGAGVSTLAAAVALRASKQGLRSVLVDVDALGGGIDLLLGVEQIQGWRWPSLGAAEGYVGDIRQYLPQVGGVAVVSMSRDSHVELAKEPLVAIIQALRRTHDLVVIDAGRSVSGASIQAVRLATQRFLLVMATVRGIAAAGQVMRAYGCDVELVVRKPAGAADATTVAELLGQRVVAMLPEDKTLAAAAERGELAWMSARRSYLRTCAALINR
ncbi:MAG: hypothetical protein FWG47_01980 [Propionibacteriaceae bacterium]|nr:hypothetical protein [Propionibacteriaceae bacterium]